MAIRLAAAALLTCAAAAAQPAGAAARRGGPWATVNICNSAAHPDEMGVRGSMPGDRTGERMYMRFHAQYYDAASKSWRQVRGKHAVSRWVFAGSARLRWTQSGYTFGFAPPSSGTTFLLRGFVDFEWRARRRLPGGRVRWVVVRVRHASTKAGHPSPGADPPGYSSATCELG